MEKGNVIFKEEVNGKEWMKLIDDVENDRSYNADPNFKFVDFIRESLR